METTGYEEIVQPVTHAFFEQTNSRLKTLADKGIRGNTIKYLFKFSSTELSEDIAKKMQEDPTSPINQRYAIAIQHIIDSREHITSENPDFYQSYIELQQKLNSLEELVSNSTNQDLLPIESQENLQYIDILLLKDRIDSQAKTELCEWDLSGKYFYSRNYSNQELSFLQIDGQEGLCHPSLVKDVNNNLMFESPNQKIGVEFNPKTSTVNCLKKWATTEYLSPKKLVNTKSGYWWVAQPQKVEVSFTSPHSDESFNLELLLNHPEIVDEMRQYLPQKYSIPIEDISSYLLNHVNDRSSLVARAKIQLLTEKMDKLPIDSPERDAIKIKLLTSTSFPLEADHTFLSYSKGGGESDEVSKMEINGKTYYYKSPDKIKVKASREQQRKVEGVKSVYDLSSSTVDKLEQQVSLREQYELNQCCFGPDHVAGTLFTLGDDFNLIKGSSLHIYQEAANTVIKDAIRDKVDTDPQRLLSATAAIRKSHQQSFDAYGKSLTELRQSSDVVDNQIAANVEKHLPALQDFYPAYERAALMGFVPDIQIYFELDPNKKADVGFLFSGNLGIFNEHGQEVLKVFDFGMPRIQFFSLESAKILDHAIQEHALINETPIVNGVMSDWYRNVLTVESRKTPIFKYANEPTGDSATLNAQDIVNVIEYITTGQGELRNRRYLLSIFDRYRQELVKYQRFVGLKN
jgi:hypothetical protein